MGPCVSPVFMLKARLLTLSNPGTECSSLSSGELLQMGSTLSLLHIRKPVSYSAFWERDEGAKFSSAQ